MSHPTLHAEEARAQRTFRALLWALSYPGRPQPLPAAADALAAIGEALIDLETSFYTPDSALAARLAFSGARPAPAAAARYQFFPVLRDADLPGLAAAPVGSYTYPDESATIVAGCVLGAGARLRLSGPGVRGATELRVGGLPDGLWELRRAAVRFPLGWELFLVDGERVVGIPRTTIVEVI